MALTTQAQEQVRVLAEQVQVTEDVVLDAAARVVTSEQVRTITTQDAEDLASWRRRSR